MFLCFFLFQVGCPNCGFSFCTKCLKKEIEVPRCGNVVKKVCLSCHEKLQKAKVKEAEIVASTANSSTAAPPATQPNIVIPKGVSVLDAEFPEADQLPDVDEALKNRLKSLQQRDDEDNADDNSNAISSDAELRGRLANLQGMPNKEYNNFDLINKVEKRTEEEQARDLMKQFMEEKTIDVAANKVDEDGNAVDPIADIERRLAALTGAPVGGERPENRENESVNVTVSRIVDQVNLSEYISHIRIIHIETIIAVYGRG